MRRSAVALAVVLPLALASCGGASGAPREAEAAGGSARADDGGRPAGAPEVEPAYQERVDRAWSLATAGENPAATCAGVKGRAAAAPPGSADRALAACNHDIPVRYFLTSVERVRTGELSCLQLMVQVTTQRSAMTVSTESFSALAREGRGAGGDEAAAGAAAAVISGEAAAGGGVSDPRQAVKDRLRDPVREACPDEASLILR